MDTWPVCRHLWWLQSRMGTLRIKKLIVKSWWFITQPWVVRFLLRMARWSIITSLVTKENYTSCCFDITFFDFDTISILPRKYIAILCATSVNHSKRYFWAVYTFSCLNEADALLLLKLLYSFFLPLIGSRIRAFDWYRPRWPWMTLNGVIALILRFSENSIALLVNYVTVVEDRSIVSVNIVSQYSTIGRN